MRMWRTTAVPLAVSKCSAGARAAHVNHNGAHAAREPHATRNHQGARPTQWWGACAPRAGERGGEAHGGPPGHRMEGWQCWASRARERGETCGGRPECGGEWAGKTVKRLPHQPPHQPAQPRCANYWASLTRKRHQQEHRPQWPSEYSDPTQHAQGRTGDCPGPREETATRWTTYPQKHGEAGGGRPECVGESAAKTEKRPPQHSAQPQYASYWAPPTRK